MTVKEQLLARGFKERIAEIINAAHEVLYMSRLDEQEEILEVLQMRRVNDRNEVQTLTNDRIKKIGWIPIEHPEDKSKLNSDDPIASDAFCGLIECASAIFTYRLTLGGGYNFTKHHKEIFDHLQAIYKLIEPYDKLNVTL